MKSNLLPILLTSDNLCLKHGTGYRALRGGKGREQKIEMLDAGRRQSIVDLVEQRNGATVAELSEYFGISAATVRRDLLQLNEQGLIERAHGGAVPKRPGRSYAFPEPPVLTRASVQVAEKECIGRAAAEYVKDGEVIIVNGGTTTAEMVPHLAERQDLTVITNALNITFLLSHYPNIEVIVLGGALRHSELSMLGALTEDALQNLRADKLFMGTPAIHPEYGLSADDMTEVQSDRNIMAAAREIIVLADHTKFGRIATMRQAPMERIRRLITDTGIPETFVTALRERGVEIEVVQIGQGRAG
jgi:DeoR family transcriptional regulator of aga operon